MSDLTPETIAELKRRSDAALIVHDDGSVGVVPGRFYVLANYMVEHAPALIAAAEECERLRREIGELKSSLRMAGDLVDALQKNEKRLLRDCRLAAAIKGT